MAGIPPVLDADAEDVAWALQTAEALWKRGERADGIVWLRRAAQAAGETEDDDRALSLARAAAELSEWMASNTSAPSPSQPAGAPSVAPTAGAAVDDLLRTSQHEIDVRMSDLPAEPPSHVLSAPVSAPAPEPPPSRPPAPIEDEAQDRISRVPSAAEKHAGLLDPWAEPDVPTKDHDVEPSVRPPPPRAPSPPPPRPPARRTPSPSPPAPTPPRGSARAQAVEGEEVVTSAPPAVRPGPAKLPPPVPPQRKIPPPPRSAPPKPPAPPTSGVDLSDVEAFADLPDDARAALAKAASLHTLAREEEISSFALALILEGTVDLAAAVADAVAARLGPSQVLRAHGTIEHVTPVRLIGASESARVATWDEDAVREAFHACPWVEDDLRAAGDRYQAEVGVTLGPLGERLDLGLRADLTRRLTMRALVEHEVYATRGKPLPGLLVVGAGELEVLGDDDHPTGDPLRAGDFVFPNEVLTAAPAPHTVRAAKGGALVLFAERGTAQELLVTCPPLMEIFASG